MKEYAEAGRSTDNSGFASHGPKKGVTADTALRLARYFDSTPRFWLNLQTAYDLRMAEIANGKRIEREIHPATKAA